MSFSQIQICNMALAKAGSTQPIASLVEASQESLWCAMYYPLAWEATARSHRWACLTRRAALAASLTETPAWGYARAYSLPADYLGWLQFEEPGVAFQRIGRTVHTDAESPNVQYVCRTEDTDLLDALFVEALVMRLAAHLAPCVGGDGWTARAAELRQWHQTVDLAAAISADAGESSVVTIESPTWLESRE